MASLTTAECAHEWVDCELYAGDQRRQRCVWCNLERAWPPSIRSMLDDQGNVVHAINPFEGRDPGDEDQP